MTWRVSEVVLPRRAAKQPSPGISPGGDCGACVIAGLLDISVEKAYRWCDSDNSEDENPKPRPYTLYSMQSAIHAWEREGFTDGYVTEYPTWPVAPIKAHWGWANTEQIVAWWSYLRMAHDGGYYAITQVDFEQKGPQKFPATNHWVMLVGTKVVREEVYLEGKHIGARFNRHVLVSCSVRGEYWMDDEDFAYKCGGFILNLVKLRAPST